MRLAFLVTLALLCAFGSADAQVTILGSTVPTAASGGGGGGGGGGLAALKSCTVVSAWNGSSETLTGDCNAYASPADAKPSVYDGTAGTVYTDPVFGTKVKRLTPQPGMPAGGYYPKYSPQQAWSKNGTYLMVGGPSAFYYLLHGTDPYTFIPRSDTTHGGAILMSQWNGYDEQNLFWMNTDDCKLLYINRRPEWGSEFRFNTIDICGASDVESALTPQANSISTIGTSGYTALKDTGGVSHDLTGGLHLTAYAYTHPSKDDTKIAMNLTGDIGDGRGDVIHGFCVFTMNPTLRTVTANFCRWFYGDDGSTGDFYWSGYPKHKGGIMGVSDDGQSLVSDWYYVLGDGDYQMASGTTSLTRTSNVATLDNGTGSWARMPNLKVGSQLTLWGYAIDSTLNATITVTGISGGTITFASTGPDETLTWTGGGCKVNGGATQYNCTGGVYFNHFGIAVYSATTGNFVKQWNNIAGNHTDQMLLSGSAAAFLGPSPQLGHSNEYRASAAYIYSSGVVASDWSSFTNVMIAQRPFSSYGNAEQTHVSGRATDLPGYMVWSSYVIGASPIAVDCNPQVVFCSEIVVSKMDGSNTHYRVVHPQNIECSVYNCYYSTEVHATPSRDLTHIIWQSAWRDSSVAYADVYLVEIPK